MRKGAGATAFRIKKLRKKKDAHRNYLTTKAPYKLCCDQRFEGRLSGRRGCDGDVSSSLRSEVVGTAVSHGLSAVRRMVPHLGALLPMRITASWFGSTAGPPNTSMPAQGCADRAGSLGSIQLPATCGREGLLFPSRAARSLRKRVRERSETSLDNKSPIQAIRHVER